MSSSQEENQKKAGSTSGTAAKLVPIVLVTICAFYALSKLRPPKHEGDYDLKAFGQLPVQQKGRVKPLDTVARNSLLIMRGKQTVPDGPEVSFFQRVFYGKKAPRYLPAIEWFAELTLRPSKADEYKVFRIDHPEVLGLFGFKPGKAKYFSFNDLFHSNDIENIRKRQIEIIQNNEQVESLRKRQADIVQEVNEYVTTNPDASEGDKLEMRERLISQYEETEITLEALIEDLTQETQDKLDSLITKVTEVERAIRSIKLGEDLNNNKRLDTEEDFNGNRVLDPGEDLNGNGRLDVSEDLNENGELDPGEDLNGNGRLDMIEDEDLNENRKIDPGPDSEKYTPYQSNLAHLYQAVTLYDQLKNGLFLHQGVNFLGTSYSKEIETLDVQKKLNAQVEELRQELLASGAIENESKLMEIVAEKPEVLELIQRDQTLKENLRKSEENLRKS